MTKKAPAMAGVAPAAVPAGYAGIHGGIVDLLDAARQTAARSVNALMTASYWRLAAASWRPSNRASGARVMASS